MALAIHRNISQQFWAIVLTLQFSVLIFTTPVRVSNNVNHAGSNYNVEMRMYICKLAPVLFVIFNFLRCFYNNYSMGPGPISLPFLSSFPFKRE
jgi:hypothetical protein